MKQPDYHTAKRLLRPVAFGVLCGAAGCMLILLIMSVIMSFCDIPLGAVPLISTCAYGAGGFISGYVGARLSGEKGMLLGLVCGAVLFFLLLLASLAGDCVGFGMQALTKLMVVMLAAAIGGILGVNRRKKFKC